MLSRKRHDDLRPSNHAYEQVFDALGKLSAPKTSSTRPSASASTSASTQTRFPPPRSISIRPVFFAADRGERDRSSADALCIAAVGRGVATWTGTKPGAAGSPSSFALASRLRAKIKLGAIACFRAASGTFAPAPTSLQRSSSFLPETSGAAARHCAKSQAAVTSSRDLRSHAPPVLTGGLLHWKD